MKTFLNSIRILPLVLLLLAAISVLPPTLAYAQTSAPASANNANTGTGAAANTNAGTAGAPDVAAQDSTPKCNLLSGFGCWMTQKFMWMLAELAFGIMQLVGFLLGRVGQIFNWMVVITVFEFGAYFANSNGMLLAWGILRDIGNLLILFGFIYAGVMMILDLHSFDARKSIPRLILFAVLLNFSLFAAEAVVDVSNALSAVVFRQAGTSVMGNCSSGNLSDCTQNVGVAGVLMQDSYAGSVLGPNSKTLAATENDGMRFMAYTGTTILLSIVLMILIAATIMFFVRAVTLVILLVISPLGFAGMALPQFEARSREWWQKLISNAFFAPIFLIIVFIGLKILEGVQNAVAGGSQLPAGTSLADAVATGGTGAASIFIIYGLVVAFFMAALLFAKQSGAAGAQFATSYAQKTVGGAWAAARRGLIQKPAAAGTRAAIKRTIVPLNKAYEAKLGQMRQSDNALARGFARTVRDIGIDEGIENLAKKAQTTRIFGERSYKEEKEHQEHRTQHLAHEAHLSHLRSDLQNGLHVDLTKPEGQEARQKAERAIQQMSEQDINEALKNAKDANEIAIIGELLSSEKYEKAMQSKELNSQIQEQLTAGRFKKIHEAKKKYDEAADDEKLAAFNALGTEMKSLSGKDTKNFVLYDTEKANSIVGMTSPDGKGNNLFREDQVNTLVGDENIPKTMRGNINNTKKSEILKKAMTDYNSLPADADADTVRKQIEAISKLMAGSNMGKNVAEISEDKIFDGTNLTEAGKIYASHLDATKMAGIMGKGELSDSAKAAILKHLDTMVPPGPQRDAIKKYLRGNAESWWGGTITEVRRP